MVTNAIGDSMHAVGKKLDVGEWLEIDRDRLDGLADATGDHRWIHVDVDRIKAGPCGATIVHGFLTRPSIPPPTNGNRHAQDTPAAVAHHAVHFIV